MPQVKLQESIGPLGLPITLWMEASKEVELRIHELDQLHPKAPYKASVPITYDGSQLSPNTSHHA